MTGVRRESSFVQPMAGQIVQPADAQLSVRSKVQSVTGQTEGKIRYAARIKSTPCGDGRPTQVTAREDAHTPTPRIRFREFNQEWGKKKLGEIATLIARKNTALESNLPLTISAEKGLVSQTSFFNNRVAAQNVTHYYLIYRGEFAYNRSSSDGSPFGAVKRLDDYEKGVLSTLYTVFASRSEFVDSNYLSVFFSTYLWHRDVRLHAAEGARNHGLLNISAEDFFKTNIMMPPSLPEQQRIASFFANLDETIAAAEARLGKLRQTKAAMLEKMFPRPGQAVPEIRFKGFEGKWEQSMAKQIFEQTNERNHPELPVLSASQQLGMIRRDEGGMNISHDKGNEPTYKRVRPRQFVLHLRSFQGGFAHSAIDGITSPAYTVFRFKNDSAHSDWFWKIVFMSETFIKSLRTITYGIRDGRSISYEEFEEMTLSYPSLSEQKRIAAFFHEMDALISATKAEAKKLRQVKAALLEGMFVQG